MSVDYKIVANHVNNIPLCSVLLQQGGDGDWTKMIEQYWADMDIEVSVDAMTLYFSLLDDYLDNDSPSFEPLTASQEADLRKLEDLHGSHDVTTTARTTTTFRTRTSTEKTITSDPVHPPVVAPTPKPKEESVTKKVNVAPETVTEESDKPKDDYSSSKMNTSKAVWAVAIVLVATIAICVIAIFGRRRCVKSQAPKNRRYV